LKYATQAASVDLSAFGYLGSVGDIRTTSKETFKEAVLQLGPKLLDAQPAPLEEAHALYCQASCQIVDCRLQNHHIISYMK